MYNDCIEHITGFVDDIPLTIIRPKGQINKIKTIIHYHGWGSEVSTYELMGQIFALNGYQFILPEISKHGKRGKIENSDSFLEAFNIVIQTFDEFPKIKDFAVNELDADEDNLLISGHSLGGGIASSILARELHIKAGILYNSFCDFDLFFEEILEKEYKEKVEIDTINLMKSYSPTNYIKNLDGRNMLILIGEKDDVIPISIMEDFKNKLKGHSIDDSKIIFSCHHDCAHGISYKMIVEALKYTRNVIGETIYEKSYRD